MDSNSKYYIGKTLFDEDFNNQIVIIVQSILEGFNDNGVHNSNGINADRLDDYHANDFIFKDGNINLIENSLQENHVKIGTKDVLNDVITQLDSSDIILKSGEIYQEKDKTFFNNDLRFTNIIRTIILALYEIKTNSLIINNGDQLTLKMYSPFDNRFKISSVTFPIRNTTDNGLMTPNDLLKFSSIDSNINTLNNNKVDKVIGKNLSTNDFTDEYVNKIDTLTAITNTPLKHFLITESMYNNDSLMKIPWSELNDEQRANLPQDILDLPEEERFYDPRDDPCNIYYFVEELPANYIPLSYTRDSPIEIGSELHNNEEWLYYILLGSTNKYYFKKVSEIFTDEVLLNVLNENILLNKLKNINADNIDTTSFLSTNNLVKINSAIQGAYINGSNVNINNNKLDLNNIVTYSYLNEAITNLNSSNIEDNSILNSKLAEFCIDTDNIIDNCITNVKLSNDSVTTNKISDNSISENKLQNNSISTDKISSIDASKITNLDKYCVTGELTGISRMAELLLNISEDKDIKIMWGTFATQNNSTVSLDFNNTFTETPILFTDVERYAIKNSNTDIRIPLVSIQAKTLYNEGNEINKDGATLDISVLNYNIQSGTINSNLNISLRVVWMAIGW